VIYLCVPTHNEARTVGVLLWKVRKVLGAFGRDYRLLVLDDASTDGTSEVLERYRRKLPLTVIRSEERLGYARSVERLLREAVEMAPYPKRDSAVVLQADFTENPDDVVELQKILEGGADIVAGCYPEELEAPGPVLWGRRLARYALGRAWGGAPVSDPLCGFRMYRVIVLKKAFRELADGEPLVRRDGWAANLEFLGRLAPHARRIEEAPLAPRYELQIRPSRFRAAPTLLSLLRLRGPGARWWKGLGAGAA
jgi:glycosyltransferase involved in cell wall biosynthesis